VILPSLPPNVLYAAYVLAFASAAVVCFGMLPRTTQISHEDTRRGLFWLLLTGGGWAAAHVGYLTMPTPELQYVFYVVGLIVGLASVGPWLYFCSAYTGRSIHRNSGARWALVAVFLFFVVVKVTNPLHGWYFAAEQAVTPFAYLRIEHRPLHWIAMGLAYALSAVGFFMLYELFDRVNSNARPLLVLVGLTGLPVVFDVLGAIRSSVLDLTYASLGVAIFAVGVFAVYFDQFQFVRATGETDDPVIVLDERDRIRDFNTEAAELLPTLIGSGGESLSEQLPSLATALDDSDSTFEIDVGGRPRYYSVASTPFTTAGAKTGRSVILSDVTHREQYRQELEEKNEKLEQFASLVSHDLRNPLGVAQGRTELAIEEDETDHLEPVVRAHDRMEQLIDEMLTLAREGVSIDEPEQVQISTVAERSWKMVAVQTASLSIEPAFDLSVAADPERLQQLFENLFRNSVEHGGTDVTITVGALEEDEGFYVADDGPGIPEEKRDEIFEAGYTTASDGTGFGLAIVSEIAEAHGWEITATESAEGGARFEIRTG
jgi:signal transduction histidine kinase